MTDTTIYDLKKGYFSYGTRKKFTEKNINKTVVLIRYYNIMLWMEQNYIIHHHALENKC